MYPKVVTQCVIVIEWFYKLMDHRLLNISKALAQSVIDAYNARPIFMLLTNGVSGDASRAVYDELVIGAKAKTSIYKLSKNITRVALIAWWRQSKTQVSEIKIMYVESNSLFGRAQMAAHATLKKMIRETNYQRRLSYAMSM